LARNRPRERTMQDRQSLPGMIGNPCLPRCFRRREELTVLFRCEELGQRHPYSMQLNRRTPHAREGTPACLWNCAVLCAFLAFAHPLSEQPVSILSQVLGQRAPEDARAQSSGIFCKFCDACAGQHNCSTWNNLESWNNFFGGEYEAAALPREASAWTAGPGRS
jgi:hypothetical protein